MKTLHTSFLLLVVCSLFSCSTIKTISKGNILYRFKANYGNGVDSVKEYMVDKKGKANIKDEGDHLIISQLDQDIEISEDQTKPILNKKEWKEYIRGSYYFPETADTCRKCKKSIPCHATFQYSENRFVLQSLTIPFKVRPTLRDSFPATTESSFTFALAPGYKRVWNRFNPYNTNLLGQHTNRWSVSGGLAVGLGTVALSTSNTRPKALYSRTALSMNLAMYVMGGFNNINVGVLAGKDYATGPYGADWIYKGKSWVGVAIGFDLIK